MTDARSLSPAEDITQGKEREACVHTLAGRTARAPLERLAMPYGEESCCARAEQHTDAGDSGR